MNKQVFAVRLKKQREACGYGTITAFATAYDMRFRNGGADLAGNNPYKGSYESFKSYENPKSPRFPKLDVAAQICEILGCDIDYLLGNIDEPKHIYQAMKEQFGLSNAATNHLIYWNRRYVKYSKMLNIFLESANFENALYHAIRLSEIKPLLDGLRDIRRKQMDEIFSNPPDCGIAYNYNGDNGLSEQIKEKELEYAAQRLYLDENFTFLIQELERLATEKQQTRVGQK